MKRLALLAFPLASALLAGCSTGASDAQRREEAINRGDASAPSKASADSGGNACMHAAGQWHADTQRCAVTPALCATTGGEWKNGKSCVVTALAGGACTGTSGMHIVDGDCVIADFSVEELAQTGMGGEK